MIITTFAISEFKNHIKQNQIFYNYIETSAGSLLILFTDTGIFEASFVDEKKIYHNYQHKDNIDIKKIILSGTKFQIKVWKAVLTISANKTVCYEDIAKIIGHPKSYRAVANALGQNKIAYFIPCHQVIRKNGEISGYKWGTDKKIALINQNCEL